MSGEMEELFGECRAWFDSGGGLVEDLLAILELANEEDVERFEREWLPYLEHAPLPDTSRCSLRIHRRFGAILPDALLYDLEALTRGSVVMAPEFSRLFSTLQTHIPLKSAEAGEVLRLLDAMARVNPAHYDFFVSPWLRAQTWSRIKIQTLAGLDAVHLLLPEHVQICLELTDENLSEAFDSLFDHPALASVVNLRLDGSHELASSLDFIAASPYLEGLERLSMTHCRLWELEDLANARNMPSLESLDLSHNDLRKDSLTALLDARHFPALAHVDLSHNAIAEFETRRDAIEAETLSRLLARWETCVLHGNGLRQEHLEYWLENVDEQIPWERLGLATMAFRVDLELMSPESFSAYLKQPIARKITHLTLLRSGSNERWGDEHLEVLANTSKLEHLEKIWLLYSGVTDEGVELLARSANLPGLRVIGANFCWDIRSPKPNLTNVLGQPLRLEWGS